ncbi:aspartate ammonia-lyase [Oceanobacillus jeddahense]|uniref:Aspartate ammonia-lyase n=1 Tax=Oceanobacillus jeddahense TaxID=1462527 RepID=A0ABY5JU37_9BACI|nr:aspartate ammonia-lyase [Oceanobacillus jeddahense]UUI03310.1 aspartate ammonia-lyase [Oceanobacillus jeddahense]
MMRTEKDSLGTLQIEDSVYYGIQTKRATLNCPVSDEKLNKLPLFIQQMVMIKKSASIANNQIGVLSKEICDAICMACDEIINEEIYDQFPVDLFQGAGGTSFNMNINEVIANRANEILTGNKGYEKVHPNNHVNLGQSTNDVLPSAMNMAFYHYFQELSSVLKNLEDVLKKKSEEFQHVVKLGRTCLQDAVPITLGQEFSGYRSFIQRQIEEIKITREKCLPLILGGTAIGTELGTYQGYLENVYKNLREISDIPVEKKENFFDGFQNTDTYVQFSSTLKSLATGLSKMANDFRIMSSGPRAGFGEIKIPAVQPGSSIMPGKVNPVMPEMMIQICYQVYGNDYGITIAADKGELDINVWVTYMLKNLTESFDLLINGIELFSEKCVSKIEANNEICQQYAEESLANSTIISAKFGYESATEVSKEAYKRDMTIQDIVVEKGLLNEKQAKDLLNPIKLADPSQNVSLVEINKKNR